MCDESSEQVSRSFPQHELRSTTREVIVKYTRRTVLKLAPAATLSLIAVPVLGGVAAADNERNFVAHLAGDHETPPNDSLAQGQAIFHVDDDGSSATFKLIVANIENVIAAHIHLAPVLVAGPIVVPLFSGAPSGRFDGILAQGTFTAANFTGPLAGHPFSDLIDAMVNGNTYVNVHTTANPGGEIRGQIH